MKPNPIALDVPDYARRINDAASVDKIPAYLTVAEARSWAAERYGVQIYLGEKDRTLKVRRSDAAARIAQAVADAPSTIRNADGTYRAG